MTAPGPLGDEARALVEAARDWAARTFPDLDTHVATGSAECQWCPVCRAVAALRSPETADRLAGAVTAAAGALAGILESLTAPAPAGAREGRPAPGPAGPGPAGAPERATPGSAGGPGAAVRPDAAYDIPIDGDA